MHKKPENNGPGFDTTDMTLPTMDRPSVVFAWFLDAMVFEQTDPYEQAMYLTCKACLAPVVEVTDEDTLRVIFNTALAHRC